MPNAIKYSTSAQTLALKKGNFWIGTGDVGKGPTSTTDYWNGITPPSGGYTIYLNKASNGPSIYTASNDTQLVSLTNTIAGASYTTAAQCLDYFSGQTDKMCFNRDYESIVTNGLVLNVDAGFTPSYPTAGTSWYDLSGNGNNASLVNGAGFNSSNGGAITFDGVDDYVSFASNIFTSGSPQNGTYRIVFLSPTFQNTSEVDLFYNGGYSGNLILLYRNPWFGTDSYNWLMYYNNGYVAAGYTYTAGQWFDSCWTWNSQGVAVLYVNGSLVNSQTMSGFSSWNMTGTNGPYMASGNTSPNGKIAIFQWYNRALTAAEVLQNYNAQKSRFGL
jgi:hypothetical protein